MRKISVAVVTAVATLMTAGCGTGGGAAYEGAATLIVSPSEDLQAILDTLRGPEVVQLDPGTYELRPVQFTDSTCGNCQDPATHVAATRGLLIRGRDIHLRGQTAAAVVLHTASGYGVFFDGCDSCSLEDITVTGGARDADGNATDAGVVVRNGTVTLSGCVIRDNLGDSATVQRVIVGVAGVVVREGGDVTVRGCRVQRNSWDGITGYREARLLVDSSVVDGVDKAAGANSGGGRGVGIGLTWNARGTIRHTLVTRYWKGIGVFMNARADIRENIVEDVLTWGLADWSAADGHPAAHIHDNVVYETGACGAMVEGVADTTGTAAATGATRPAADSSASVGELTGNAFVSTGRDRRYDSGQPYCPQRPIARVDVPPGFVIRDNLVLDARQPGNLPAEPTVDTATFRTRAAELLKKLSAYPNLRTSRFLRTFGPA